MSDICPLCHKEITVNDEVFINGGGPQTNFSTEKWHKGCAEKEEEFEIDNDQRQ